MELDEVREFEESNYQNAVKLLGESVSLSEDLVDLHRVMREIVVKSKIAGDDVVVACLNFLLACQYQLTIGCLAALRGHITDAIRSSRMALELAAFGARVKRHPHLALVWLNAGHSADAYEEYRTKFSFGKIFPDDHELLRQLNGRCDHASKLSHPSVYALAGQTKAGMTAEGFNLAFDYFQLDERHAGEPVRTFLWIIDTHFKILTLFEESVEDALAHDLKAWEVRRNAVEAKLEVHKDRWRAFADSRRQ